MDDSEPALRVIVCDDDPLARRAVCAVLREAGMVVIAEAGSGREAVELVEHYQPDVVVMDVVMPGSDGIAATRTIADLNPRVQVVLLTASEDENLALIGVLAGASGCLTKTASLDALPRALRGVVRGEAAISRSLAMRAVVELRRHTARHATMRPVRSSLSAREWEVLDLLCQDAGTEEIAETLVISVQTVRSHVKAILRKLDVGSRREAVDVALRLRGLADGSD